LQIFCRCGLSAIFVFLSCIRSYSHFARQIREKLTENPSPEEVKSIRDRNEAELRRLYAQVSQGLRSGQYSQVKDLLLRVQYLEKISDELHAQFFDLKAGPTSPAVSLDGHASQAAAVPK
jgi:hypothetical protein